MIHDPNNPEDVKQRRLTDKALQVQAAEDWAAILDDPRGARVLGAIMERCGMMSASYVPNDALATAYMEGHRAIGIWLVSMIAVAKKS